MERVLPGRQSMLFPVYLPTFLLSFGQGLIVYTLPLYAHSLGGDLAQVGLVVAAAGVGTFLTDIPAGMVLTRFGRGPLMLVGTIATALTCLGVGLFHAMPPLVLLRLVGGAGAALWSLSRMAYVIDLVPLSQRGRVLSTFGGTNRAGTFAGPVVGGLIAARFGLASPFLFANLLAALATVCSAMVAADRTAPRAATSRTMRWRVVGRLLRTETRELATAGSAQVFAQVIRNGRQLIVPLYASTTLGLGVEVVGLIGSISAVVDMSMFLPAGILMDRYGRKFASVPCFLIMAVSMALLPFTHNAPEMIAVTILMGVGNGLGSGSMMTLGTDLAPRNAMGEFLGLWRLTGDAGGLAGPILVGDIAALVGLASAAYVLAGVGALAAGTLAIFVRETLQRGPPLDLGEPPGAGGPGSRGAGEQGRTPFGLLGS